VSIVHSEALPYLLALPAASIDLIVTDPPYGIKKEASWDCWPSDTAYLAWLREHLVAMRTALKPNGSLYLFAAPQLAARVEVLVGEVFHVLNHIVWVKTNGTTNQRADRAMLRSYLTNTERIIFAEHPSQAPEYEQSCNGLRGTVFDSIRCYLLEEVKRAGAHPDDINEVLGFRRNGGMASRHYFSTSQWCLPTQEHYEQMRHFLNTRNGKSNYLTRDHAELQEQYNYLSREYEFLRREYEDLRRPFVVHADGYETEVWPFPVATPDPQRHICEKPVGLLRYAIRVSSRPGALVCDPFCGSGSTLDAARQEGRQWCGCDADATWVARAQRRLEAPYTMALFA
jgi:adenine-specific DNA-methyltransferase